MATASLPTFVPGNVPRLPFSFVRLGRPSLDPGVSLPGVFARCLPPRDGGPANTFVLKLQAHETIDTGDDRFLDLIDRNHAAVLSVYGRHAAEAHRAPFVRPWRAAERMKGDRLGSSLRLSKALPPAFSGVAPRSRASRRRYLGPCYRCFILSPFPLGRYSNAQTLTQAPISDGAFFCSRGRTGGANREIQASAQ